MKINRRKIIALVLTVALIGTTVTFTAGNTLKASEGDDSYVAEEQKEQSPEPEKAEQTAPAEKTASDTEEINIDQDSDNSAEAAAAGGEEQADEDMNSEEQEEETADTDKPKMPAQEFSKTAGNGIRVKVSAPEGAFPENTEMKVSAVSSSRANQLAERGTDAEFDVEDAAAVDISFYDKEGKKLEPADEESVKVSLSLSDELDGEEFAVLHQKSNGQIEEITSASVNAGGADFSAESFSTYVVVGGTSTSNVKDATVKASIKDADAIMIAYHTASDWKQNSFKTLSDGETVTVKGFTTSRDPGYILVFVKGTDGHIITGLGASGANNLYPVDGPYGVNGGGNSRYPAISDIAATAKAMGYEALFGWSRTAGNTIDNANFTVVGQKVGISVAAVCTTQNLYLVPGDKVDFDVTITPDKLQRSGSSVELDTDSTYAMINGVKYNISGLKKDSSGNYKGTVTYELTAADCKAGSVSIDVTGKLNYGYNLTNTIHTTATVTGNGSTKCKFNTLRVELEANSKTVTYNGQEQSVSGYTVNGQKTDTFTYDGIEYKVTVNSTKPPQAQAKGTDAGTYESDIDEDAVTITRVKDGKDVTSIVSVNIVKGKLLINPAPLTVTTGSASKAYDGKALTKDEAGIEGLVNGETASPKATGSQTDVGSSKNTYEISWGTAKADNYTITDKLGKLEVTASQTEITLTAPTGSKTYDGKALTKTEGVTATGLPEGFTVEAKAKGSQTDAGSSANVIQDGYIIRDAEGNDKTSYFTNITKVNGSLTVNPAPLKVTTPTDSKVYDGTALKAEGSIDGFVNGETATFTTTGSQTNVGSSDNTYSLVWDGTAREGNYTVTTSIGTLTVTENQKEIVVTTTGGTWTYDGKAHGATVEVSELPAGYTLVKAESSASATDVTKKDVEATADQLVIKNGKGEDVTSKLKITYNNDTIKITPAPLTVTTPDASKTYDGTALTAEGKIEGLVNGETAGFSTTGSQTEVGSSDNTYEITWAGLANNYSAKESNYTVTPSVGTLTVSENTAKITVTTKGGTWTYDGQAHGAKVTVSDLPEGYTLVQAASSASATDVTTEAVAATADTLVIRNAAGTDVTSRLNIEYVNGTIEINPAKLTVTTLPGSKVYDGEPLTAEGSITGFVNKETASFTTTGSQTDVGTSDNTYKLEWNGTAKEGNYTIDESLGTLTVSEYSDEIIVTTTGGTWTYDGQAHGATVSVSNLPNGYSLEAALSDAAATDVTSGVPATADILVIRNSKDEDVTARLNIRYVDGTIVINPAELTVTTPDANKEYDGEALTAKGSITGFVNDETASFATTGSQTEVGSSDNTYTLTFDKTAKEGNYTVKDSVGTLTVSESTAKITVTTTGGEWTYDGEEHGATVEVTALPKGYTLEKAESSASATDVTAGLEATADQLIIRNAEGTDVTAALNIDYVNGKIIINPATLTVTMPAADKVYDGEALTSEGSISGFIKKETAAFKTTGTQTEVGQSDNTYSLEWNGTAKKSNYTIKESIGKLTVTESEDEIVVTTTGGTWTYDGQAHGATVTVSDTPAGYRVDTAKSSASATDVTSAPVKATADQLVIKNAKGEDVTSKLKITYADSTITINPAPLTVTTPDASKVYDGTALKAEGSMSGLVNGETAGFGTTGSQTEVGSSDNTYRITWSTGLNNYTAKESNYTVTPSVGTLTVSENTSKITVTTTGGTWTYDGQAHGATVEVSELPAGYTLETATSDASATDVTTKAVSATADTLVIRNAAGTNVTSRLNIEYVNGTIVINPAKLTVKTPSDSKVYDGEALTAEGSIEGFVNKETASFTTTGSQTEVGSSDNTYSLVWDGTAKEGNYTIDESLGTLTVSESSDEITVTTTGGTWTYDGQAHGATVSVSKLPKGYTLDTATSDASATDVTAEAVKARADTLIIRNGKGEDVTSKLNIKYVDGTIVINPAELTVTTSGATKVYDGTELTAEGSISGFVNGETATFITTGGQTEVGSSDNTYSLKFDKTAKAGNYTVKEDLGTLEVTEYAQPITVTVTGGTWVYDGDAHKAAVEVSRLPQGYTLETAESTASATDVTKTPVVATADKLVIRNAAGDDVTSRLNIQADTATLTVTPAPLKVETKGATKVYDGEALTNSEGSVTGFLKNEKADLTTTGSQTEVGNSDNTYEIDWANATAKKSNYEITEESLGKLVVTESENEIVVTTTGGTWTYDGQAHGATVAVSQLPKGYSLGAASSSASATDVTTEAVKATADTLVIRNAAGTDVTSKLKITYVDDSIQINPAELTVVTNPGAKTYDGTPLTADGSISGFVNGESAEFQTTGSQTSVGSSDNTYSITWSGQTAKRDNYTIKESIGQLVVSEYAGEITVTTTGGTKTYDGTPQTATVSVSALPQGYVLETASSDATATDVTTEAVTATADNLVIRNAQGEDVTSKLNITKVDGTIIINPAKLTVVTPTADKVYDGDPLTAEGSVSGFVNGETAPFTTTGSQTEVGTSDNTYEIGWTSSEATAKEGNYTVDASVGKLTVKESEDEIVVTTTGGTWTYDGKSHGATVAVSDLPKGYTLEKAESSASARDVTKKEVTATADKLVIRNASGKDVTDQLKITYVDGGISINPLKITVVTKGASKQYDSKALKSGGTASVEDGGTYTYTKGDAITVDLVEGETASFRTTGSQTKVGKSDNTYELKFGSDETVAEMGASGEAAEMGASSKASNYIVEEELGTLRVKAAPDGTNPTPAPGPGVGPGNPGNTAAVPGTNGVTLTQLQDEQTPLSNNILDWFCCYLHVIILILALIVLLWYTRDMKKRQRRIFDLEEELEDHNLQ